MRVEFAYCFSFVGIENAYSFVYPGLLDLKGSGIRVDNTSEQAQVRGQEPEVKFSLIRKFNCYLRFPMRYKLVLFSPLCISCESQGGKSGLRLEENTALAIQHNAP